MKEMPILFKGPLVRAILRDVDPKTQTRRLITRLRGFGRIREFGPSDTPGYDWTFRDHRGTWNDISDKRLREVLPYQVGDRLWVREGFKTLGYGRAFGLELHYQAYGYDPATQYEERARFRRIFEEAPDRDDKWRPLSFGPWRPSIHMFRWMSRIDLEVTQVRVQRLQDITEEDARAEGFVHGETMPAKINGEPGQVWFGNALSWFSSTWDAINGAKAVWASNPWVWAIAFKRIRP